MWRSLFSSARPSQIDVPRRVAGIAGNVLGIGTLVALMIGPWPLQFYRLAPDLWALAIQYDYLVVLALVSLFCALGQLFAAVAYWVSHRVSEAICHAFARRPRSSIFQSRTMCLGAVITSFGIAFAYEWAWWSAGGGDIEHDQDTVGMVETGFVFLIAASLISGLSVLGFLHPEFSDRATPSDNREQAWCMLTVEAWAAGSIGAFSYFTLTHKIELIAAGLNVWWIGSALL